MALQNKLQRCLTWHKVKRKNGSIFLKINALILEHIIIKLFPKPRQQVKYEQKETFDKAMVRIKQKEKSLKRFHNKWSLGVKIGNQGCSLRS